ncbi:hypothetical protein [Flectobacillus major]|uniref:hypothetical protein n=1 Tax=Flectobacillus major TaxID=103 RepID=UPI000423686F|nr:hypothetical protein [Flectobacillus major]
MKKILSFLPMLFAMAWILSGCKGSDKEPSVEEKLTKIWSAKVVKEGADVVYDKTATSQKIPGYANYKLDLTSKTAAKLTEKDGITFTGTWSISSDNQTLTISGLTSASGAPTGTSGTMTYKIVGSVTTTAVTLETATPYIKASNTIANYQLVNP